MKTATIIGSGIAGLAIAEILTRNGYFVYVLEKDSKIGGDASMSTQKWFHTGWLYSSLPNSAAMLGCYNAMNLYKEIYNIQENNLQPPKNGDDIYVSKSENGWFDSNRINYLFTKNTYELTFWESISWRLYMRFISLRRLEKLGYKIKERNIPTLLYNLICRWEKNDNAYKKYKMIESTDLRLNTHNIVRSLVARIDPKRIKFVTNAKFTLSEKGESTYIYCSSDVSIPVKSDLIIFASGSGTNNLLNHINKNSITKNIKSVKSPILVLNRSLPYESFIRYTPNTKHTVNHIKYKMSNGEEVSTIGSYHYCPVDETMDTEKFIDDMIKWFNLRRKDIKGLYFGVKTEFTGSSERRYNHALEKVNDNTWFALAGKYSQFPLLVDELSKKVDTTLRTNIPMRSFDKNCSNLNLIGETKVETINNK